MNFFQHQEDARRRTRQLLIYFGLAVVLLIGAIYLAVMVIFQVSGKSGATGDSMAAVALWNPIAFGWTALVTVTVITLGSLYKIGMLHSGGETVARMLGGAPVDPHTRNPDERRLLNVVEEMAIASGVPVPQVFVLDAEAGINAFAAGFTPRDAVVAVTHGALRTLTRDELQGVIAHEFSHILNGDMRLNLQLIGTLHGIQLIALIGYWILRHGPRGGGSSRGRSRKGGGGGAILLFALALLIIGWIGVFFARLIKAAVSRQREFLADAAAVQFTRNPDGLGGALRKIGGLAEGSRIQSAQAEAASHLFFASGVPSAFEALFATHPPLRDRIRRIDPTFDGVFRQMPPRPAEAPAPPRPPPPAARPPPMPQAAAALAIAPAEAPAHAGTLSPEVLAGAAVLLAEIPEALRDPTRDGLGAQAVCAALLLARDADTRRRQLQALAETPGLPQEAQRLAPAAGALPAAARLPMAELALQGLRTLSRPQYDRFRAALMTLAAMDEQITLFEYALMRLVIRNMDPHFGRATRRAAQYYSLAPLLEECGLLLSALARAGAADEARVASAYSRGWTALGVEGSRLLQPAMACTMAAVDKALDRLALTPPLLRERVVRACAACAAADSQLSVEEGELLRAVADALDCPLPPFLPKPRG